MVVSYAVVARPRCPHELDLALVLQGREVALGGLDRALGVPGNRRGLQLVSVGQTLQNPRSPRGSGVIRNIRDITDIRITDIRDIGFRGRVRNVRDLWLAGLVDS